MEFIKPFLVGGGLIAGSKLVSLKIDPIYAPLLAAFPTSYLTSFFLKNDNVRKKYYYGNLIADTLLTFSILFIFLSIRFFPQIPINYFSVAGYFLWLIVSFLFITLHINLRNK